MRITIRRPETRTLAASAFTIVEVVLGMSTVAILFVALYSGIMSGYAIIKMARENTRATQIMVEKMETIRLYTWDQINSNGFLLANFTVPYYPMGGSNCGIIYSGTMGVSNVNLGTTYQGDMRLVTVTLNWRTGALPRQRSISTYVSRYGLQNYIY